LTRRLDDPGVESVVALAGHILREAQSLGLLDVIGQAAQWLEPLSSKAQELLPNQQFREQQHQQQ